MTAISRLQAQEEDEHRHNSHLYGLYPGLVLANDLTPELTAAIKKTLEQRGNGGKGVPQPPLYPPPPFPWGSG